MSQHMRISVLIKMPKKYKLRRACADPAIAASIHKTIEEKPRVEGDKEDGFVQNISNMKTHWKAAHALLRNKDLHIYAMP